MVQINSVYVNGGQTVITLFVSDDNKIFYIVDDIQSISRREVRLEKLLTAELQQEVEAHAEKVWGSDENLYILKVFIPISQNLAQFILSCWHEVRLNEKHLFNK